MAAQYYNWHSERGFRTCIIAERGRKWMTLLVIEPQLKALKVRSDVERHMTPLTTKNDKVYKTCAKRPNVTRRAKLLLKQAIKAETGDRQ
tara:strand:+ start:2307 stop:2576 length:270 start_codon:yes stop_codon:yes gene_type:complete